jgi:hypothetical protein
MKGFSKVASDRPKFLPKGFTLFYSRDNGATWLRSTMGASPEELLRDGQQMVNEGRITDYAVLSGDWEMTR